MGGPEEISAKGADDPRFLAALDARIAAMRHLLRAMAPENASAPAILRHAFPEGLAWERALTDDDR